VFYFIFPQFNKIRFPFNLTGIAAIICGYYITRRSSGIFEKNNTTFYLKEPSAFIQTGFYRISRNPMYLGLLIFIFGLAVLTGNLISLISPVLFFLFINCLCIPPEEKLMERIFGNSYIEYKQKVRRWL